MRIFLALLGAVAAVSLAPPVAFAPWLLAESGEEVIPLFPLALIAGSMVSFLHMLVLGVPAAGWLLKIGAFRFFPMLSAGFVGGCLCTRVEPSRFTQADAASRHGMITAPGPR